MNMASFDPPFKTVPYGYWSSTEYDYSRAWYVDFTDGRVARGSKMI